MKYFLTIIFLVFFIFPAKISANETESNQDSTSTNNDEILVQEDVIDEDSNENINKELQENLNKIIISEVYPAPNSEGNEWIELYNPNTQAVNISGWQLFEHFSKTNSLISFQNIIIEAKNFYVYTLPSNKLNNSEEKVSLSNNQNQTIDELYYKDSESEKSFSKLFKTKDEISEKIELTNPSKNEINPLLVTDSLPEKNVDNYNNSKSENEKNKKDEKQITDTKNFQEKDKQTKNKKVDDENSDQAQLFLKVHKQLKFPKLERLFDPNLTKKEKKFSYLVQKKVSKHGVIGAIIGGSLLLLTGLIL